MTPALRFGSPYSEMVDLLYALKDARAVCATGDLRDMANTGEGRLDMSHVLHMIVCVCVCVCVCEQRH